MSEILITADTLPLGYHKALIALKNKGDIVDCADWNTTCKDVSMTIEVLHPLEEPRISKCFIGGPGELQQYVMEMLDGILDFEVEKGNWVYTYHDRMVRYPYGGKVYDQIQFVIDDLKRNPSSRRAVVLVRDGSDIGSDDPACLQHIQFFVRNGKLDCKVLFRSNDACKATFMNAFALIMIQKRVADALGVDMGTYTHRASSFHCYEKDFPLLDGYVKRIEEDEENCLIDYEDEWQDLMEDEIPEILKKVEELRNH